MFQDKVCVDFGFSPKAIGFPLAIWWGSMEYPNNSIKKTYWFEIQFLMFSLSVDW
jgi:hypothetical protein